MTQIHTTQRKKTSVELNDDYIITIVISSRKKSKQIPYLFKRRCLNHNFLHMVEIELYSQFVLTDAIIVIWIT